MHRDEESDSDGQELSRSDTFQFPRFVFSNKKDWEMLLKNRSIPGLVKVCGAFQLSKEGKKGDLIERIISELHNLYSCGKAAEFNQMAGMINELPCRFGRNLEKELIRKMDDPAFEAASKAKEFKIDKEDLLAPYRIIQAVSDPVYFPAVPDRLDEYELKFSIDHKSINLEGKNFVAVLLKVYNHQSLPDHPAEGSVRYRLSRGRDVKIKHGYTILAPPYQLSGPKYMVLERFLPYGTQRIMIYGVEETMPYYFQVFLVEHDARLAALKPLRTAEKIKSDYIAQEHSSGGVLATTVRLSLRCPLSMTRITVPIRWPSCRHLQCLDLSSWNSFKPTQNISDTSNRYCPICEKPVVDDDCFTDGFSKMILEQTGEDVVEVTIEVEEKDLKWSLLTPSPSLTGLIDKMTPLEIESPAGPKGKITIDLTEDNTVYPTPWVDPPPKPSVDVDPSELFSKKAKPSTTAIDLNSNQQQQQQQPVPEESDVSILDMTMDRRNGGTLLDAIEID